MREYCGKCNLLLLNEPERELELCRFCFYDLPDYEKREREAAARIQAKMITDSPKNRTSKTPENKLRN